MKLANVRQFLTPFRRSEGDRSRHSCGIVRPVVLVSLLLLAGAAKADQLTVAAIASASLTIPATNSPPAIKGLESDQCFDIEAIVITGLEMVPVEEVRTAVAPLAWRCMGNMLAKAVIGAVNEVHAAHGFVTTQGYVRPQDIRGSRRLVINVITGRIARIVPREHRDDETFGAALRRAGEAGGPWELVSAVSAMWGGLAAWPNRFQLIDGEDAPGLKTRLAMPADPGEPLNIDRIQQGIDQLNRSPSHKASAKLVPGTEPGTSDVVVDLPETRSFRLTTGYEINGGSLNGQNSISDRARIDIAKDNLLGLNDSWAATFASGVQSNEVRASVVAPVRWLTLSGLAGYSEYFTMLAPNVALFQQIETAGLNGSYVISRDRSQLTSVDAGFTVRHVLRFINLFELEPRNVSIVRLGLSQTRYFKDAQLTYSIGYSRGLAILSATRDAPDADATTPRAQFDKIDVSASYTRLFPSIGALRFDLAGQYARTPLFQEDELALGSISTVRGFARSPAFADRGIFARGEFTPVLPVAAIVGDLGKQSAFYADVLNATHPYVFVDAGVGRNVANAETVSRASVGVGLRYNLGRVNLDWSLAKPLAWSGVLPGSQAGGLETYLNMTFSLF